MAHSSTTKRVILAVAVLALFCVTFDLHAQGTSIYKRGTLVEEFTGTWCPHCPPGTWALDTLEKKYGDNLVVISWHGGPSLPGPSGYEDLWIPVHDTLFSFFGLTGWPEAPMNRSLPAGGFSVSNIPHYTLESAIPTIVNKTPSVDYRIVNAVYNSGTRTVDFDVDVTPYDMTKMRSDDTTLYGTLAVLTEDNVLESQANEPDWSVVTDNPINDFHEMNVARLASGSGIFGDAFTMGTKNPTQTLPNRIHYTMVVDNAWSDANVKVKTFAQATYPKKAKSIGVEVFDAKQTGYLTSLPSTPPSAAWVVLPNANSSIKPTTNIVWATGGIGNGNAMLEYSIDNGTTWNTIVASTNQSPYAWTIPQSAYGATAKIRVSVAGSASINGLSDAIKTPGIITVTAPKAGEVINGDVGSYTITITGGNLKSLIKFELSTDNGTTWPTVIGNLGNDNATQYNWNVTNPTADQTQCVIRVTDANGVVGLSGVFTIKAVAGAKGTITNITLAGPTNYQIDNNRNLAVLWNVAGNIGTGTDVYFSSNGGTDWVKETTTPLKPDSTFFQFKTPKTGYYPNCTVKVQSSSDATISSVWKDGDVTSFAVGQASGVSMNNDKGYSISNYPNPFASETTIKFTLPVTTYVTIRVLDNLGREVDHLVTQTLEAGEHTVPFNSTNLANGVYTYILESGSTKLVGKMSILK